MSLSASQWVRALSVVLKEACLLQPTSHLPRLRVSRPSHHPRPCPAPLGSITRLPPHLPWCGTSSCLPTSPAGVRR